MCHHSSMFQCCEVTELQAREFPVSGGGTFNLGSQQAEVKFFYYGGFGSGQPLGKLNNCSSFSER